MDCNSVASSGFAKDALAVLPSFARARKLSTWATRKALTSVTPGRRIGTGELPLRATRKKVMRVARKIGPFCCRGGGVIFPLAEGLVRGRPETRSWWTDVRGLEVSG